MNPGPTLPRMQPQELAAMLNLADTTTRWAALETLARTSRRGDDSWHFLAFPVLMCSGIPHPTTVKNIATGWPFRIPKHHRDSLMSSFRWIHFGESTGTGHESWLWGSCGCLSGALLGRCLVAPPPAVISSCFYNKEVAPPKKDRHVISH